MQTETELEESSASLKRKEEARARQEERDYSKFQKIKVLVRGHCTKTLCQLNEVFHYITNPNINLTEQIAEFTDRQDPQKSKAWTKTKINEIKRGSK